VERAIFKEFAANSNASGAEAQRKCDERNELESWADDRDGARMGGIGIGWILGAGRVRIASWRFANGYYVLLG